MIRHGRALWISGLVVLLWGCMMGASNPSPTSEKVRLDPPTPTSHIFDSSTLPPVTPIQEAEPPHCPKAPRSRLVVNERGRVTENGKTLNIRSAAGTQYELIGRMVPGAVFFVIDGPRCSGAFVWFYIEYQGMQGWIAEADTEVIYAQPYLDG